MAFREDDNSNWKKITIDDLQNLNASEKDNKDYLNSITPLYTEALSKELEPGQTAEVELNVSKVLTTSSDTTFDNKAEVVKISRPSNPQQHRGAVVRYYPIGDAETFEVTPSTGENREFIMTGIIGAALLIVLCGGVYIIKKRVIGNK